MNNYNIIAIILFIVSTIAISLAAPPTTGLTSVTLSQNQIKFYDQQSVTFTFTIVDSNTITDGFLEVSGNSYASTDYNIKVNGNTQTITYCIPWVAFTGCYVGGVETNQCVYTFNYYNGAPNTFSSDQIFTTFGASTNISLIVPQNDPIVNYNMYTNSIDLVGVALNISFGYEAQFSSSVTIVDSKSNTQQEYQSNNGYQSLTPGIHFFDFKVNPSKSTTYKVKSITITTYLNDEYQFTPTDNQQVVLNNTFTQYYDASLPLINLVNTTGSFNLTGITSYKFDYKLSNTSPNYLTSVVPLVDGCSTYYTNRTHVSVYCDIPPYFTPRTGSVIYGYVGAHSPFGEGSASFGIPYDNTFNNPPNIVSLSTSVLSIDKLEPFWMEFNYTYNVPNSTFGAITPGIYGSGYITPEMIISGNLSNGVASKWILVDSKFTSLTSFTSGILNTAIQIKSTFSIPTTQAPSVHDASVTFEFGSFGAPLNLQGVYNIPVLATFETANNDDLLFADFDLEGFSYGDVQVLGWKQIKPNAFQGVITVSQFATVFGPLRSDYMLTISTLTSNNLYGDVYSRTEACYYIAPSPISNTPKLASFTVDNKVINFTSPNATSKIVNFQLQFLGKNVDHIEIAFEKLSLITLKENSIRCDGSYYTQSSNLQTFLCAWIVPSGIQSTNFIFEVYVYDKYFSSYLITSAELISRGFQSSLQVIGRTNQSIPTLTSFATKLQGTIYTITYNYSNTQAFDRIQFRFDGPISSDIQNYDTYTPSGSVSYDICDAHYPLPPYYTGNQFRLVAAYFDVNGIFYSTPHSILAQMDSGDKVYSINTLSLCDYSAPRLLKVALSDGVTTYDTQNGAITANVQFTITDDKSGFSLLMGRLVSRNNMMIIPFNITSAASIGQGIYNQKFKFPQYTNDIFDIYVDSLMDVRGNQQSLTLQNVKLVAQNSLSYIELQASTSVTIPTVTKVDVLGTQVQVTFSSNPSSATVEFLTGSEPKPLKVMSGNKWTSMPIIPDVTGRIYFSICVVTSNYVRQCYSWLDLKNTPNIGTTYFNNPTYVNPNHDNFNIQYLEKKNPTTFTLKSTWTVNPIIDTSDILTSKCYLTDNMKGNFETPIVMVNETSFSCQIPVPSFTGQKVVKYTWSFNLGPRYYASSEIQSCYGFDPVHVIDTRTSFNSATSNSPSFIIFIALTILTYLLI